MIGVELIALEPEPMIRTITPWRTILDRGSGSIPIVWLAGVLSSFATVPMPQARWSPVSQRVRVPAQFREYFAADLSAEQAAFESRSQVVIADVNFKAVITTPAWKTKPSWMLVAAKDRTINPDLERWYAARANSHKVEVSGASHSVYVSRPKEVAALIEEAASKVP